jgi:LuxR family maltose regulon positive regulatory protein
VGASKPARLFRRHVRRDRLTALLDAAEQPIIVTAPAGYGKTTLLEEWLHARRRVIWYRPTRASSDLAAFAVELAGVVEEIAPKAAERLRARVRVGASLQPRPLGEVFASALDAWPRNGHLVIDDYQLAGSPLVDQFVEYLVERTPIRLVVATRRRPTWATTRRMLHGEILELGAHQLAMTDDEAFELLGERSAESRAIVELAEGWPVLLGLAARSADVDPSRRLIPETLFRYFAEEVLQEESPEVRDLLLRESVSPTVQGDADILERLVDDGLLQRTRTEFRLHPLLRDFLRERFRSEQPQTYAALSARAIAEARLARRWDDAFELALESGAVDEGAAVLGEAAPELLAEGRVATVEAWLERCSSAADRLPAAALARAETRMRQGRLKEARAIALDVAQRLTSNAAEAFRAWHLAARTASLLSDEHQALRYELEARKAARTEDEMRKALWALFLAAAELELDEAGSYLEQVAALPATELDENLLLASGRKIWAAHQGSFAGVWELFEPLLPLATRAANPLVGASFLANAAYVSWARADYTTAARLATEALELCAEYGLDFATGVCLYHRAQAEIGLRRLGRARGTIDQLAPLASADEDPFHAVAHAVLELKLAIVTGTFEAEEDPVLDERVSKSVRGEFLGLHAIARAAIGEEGKARAEARHARRLTKAIESRYYAAFAELMVSHAEPAPLVRRALDAEFADAVVTAYRAAPRVAHLALDDPSLHERLCQLLLDTGDVELARDVGIELMPKRVRMRSAVPLTPREREILELMGRGLGNREIATKLVISENTVKVHVRHILEKLGVRNRLQAALQASQLRDTELVPSARER